MGSKSRCSFWREKKEDYRKDRIKGKMFESTFKTRNQLLDLIILHWYGFLYTETNQKFFVTYVYVSILD